MAQRARTLDEVATRSTLLDAKADLERAVQRARRIDLRTVKDPAMRALINDLRQLGTLANRIK
jgi:hypothetical protein